MPAIALDRTQPRMYARRRRSSSRTCRTRTAGGATTAQRLLVLKQDKSVVPALQTLARTSSNLLARFHAMWTLEGLGALDAALVRER